MAKRTIDEMKDEDAEVCLCGSFMNDPEKVIPICIRGGVSEATFVSEECRRLWASAKDLHGRKQPVDVFTVKDNAERMGKPVPVEFLQRCLDETPTAAHAEYYLQVVNEGVLGREIRDILNEGFKGLASGGGAQKVYGDLVKRIHKAEGKAYGGNAWVNLENEADKIEAEWMLVHDERLVKKNLKFINGVPLPWDIMNRLYTGMKEGLHIWAARPSQGKTALAVNACEFWDQIGMKHAVVSIDMSAGNLFKRFASSVARVSLPKLEWGARMDQIDAAMKVLRGIAKRGNLLLTEEYGIERLKSVICEAVHRHGARVILVDYLQVVDGQTDGRRTLQRNEEVGMVVRTLKELSKQLHVPIILLCQLSREVSKAEDRKPRLDDLGDSGEIERAAASVAFLHVDQKTQDLWRECPPIDLAYGYDYLAPYLRPVFFILSKNQNGSTGELPFVLYPHYFMFRPGDPYAKAVREQVPNTKREELRDWPRFSRICDDWRTLPEDEHLRKKGILGPRVYEES